MGPGPVPYQSTNTPGWGCGLAAGVVGCGTLAVLYWMVDHVSYDGQLVVLGLGLALGMWVLWPRDPGACPGLTAPLEGSEDEGRGV